MVLVPQADNLVCLANVGNDLSVLKNRAAQAALPYVKGGMRVGLGTGTTAEEFIKLLSAKVAEGLNITCVPTSVRTSKFAAAFGLELTDIARCPSLDLLVDGADEIDGQLRMLKGGGGALLREKIVASAANEVLIIVDSSKLVNCLGSFPLSIEIVPFGLDVTCLSINRLFASFGFSRSVLLCKDETGSPFVTDGCNYLLRVELGIINDPSGLATALTEIPGVVDHGIFVDIATMAIVAGCDGLHYLHPK